VVFLVVDDGTKKKEVWGEKKKEKAGKPLSRGERGRGGGGGGGGDDRRNR